MHRKVVHEGIKDHKCGSCGKSFSFGHHLKSHFKTVHEGLKEFNCESCGKIFARSEHLKKHANSSHGGNENKCVSCNKAFYDSVYLKNHIITVHEGRKDHKCDICSKMFGLKTSLTRHMKLHAKFQHLGKTYYFQGTNI